MKVDDTVIFLKDYRNAKKGQIATVTAVNRSQITVDWADFLQFWKPDEASIPWPEVSSTISLLKGGISRQSLSGHY
jgi:hypothetical protein